MNRHAHLVLTCSPGKLLAQPLNDAVSFELRPLCNFWDSTAIIRRNSWWDAARRQAADGHAAAVADRLAAKGQDVLRHAAALMLQQLHLQEPPWLQPRRSRVQPMVEVDIQKPTSMAMRALSGADHQLV
jgi:hypothetical protein